jgi:hypothetical protein
VSGTLSPSSRLVRKTLFGGESAHAQTADIALTSIPSLQTLNILTPAHLHAFSVVRALLCHAHLPGVGHFKLYLCSLDAQAESTQMETPAPRCTSIHVACVHAHVMQ